MSGRRPLGSVDVNRRKRAAGLRTNEDGPPTKKSSFMQATSSSKRRIDEDTASSKENSSRTSRHQILKRSSETVQTDTGKLSFKEQKALAEELSEELKTLKTKNNAQMDHVHELRQTQKDLMSTVDDLSAKIEAEKDFKINAMDICKKLNLEIEESLKIQKDQTAEIEKLEESQAAFTSRKNELSSDLSTLDLEFKTKIAEVERLKVEIEEVKQAITSAKEGIKACNEKAQITDLKRRKYHNQIQELRGNIRVFCRVRPPKEENDSVVEMEKEGECRSLRILSAERSSVSGSRSSRQSHDYTFDRVFGPDSAQGDVFAEVEQVVQSALDGYKVCIFAYGQTGSGKTFTMEGPEDLSFDGYFSECNDEKRGMIPRAVEQIFATVDKLAEKGWVYKLEASFLEIYCESIRDLLSKGNKSTSYDIKHSGDDTHVTNLSVCQVEKADDIYPLLAIANQSRSVGKTNMNSRSSRSHSIFQLRIEGVHEALGKTSKGMLNLIDLAGSERLKQSKSDQNADRLKETQFINKSLSCLGDIIKALGDGSSFVPYRNSKLTYLLKNCFGGSCKTMMLVNIAPEDSHSSETISSLRFASKVNSTHVGTAKKNVSG